MAKSQKSIYELDPNRIAQETQYDGFYTVVKRQRQHSIKRADLMHHKGNENQKNWAGNYLAHIDTRPEGSIEPITKSYVALLSFPKCQRRNIVMSPPNSNSLLYHKSIYSNNIQKMSRLKSESI